MLPLMFQRSVTSILECEVLAIDLRGHGGSKTSDDGDLSVAVMANDVAQIITYLYPKGVKIILIGHSMGGAIAVHAANMDLIPNLYGVAVIGVLGDAAAMDALNSKQSCLRGRPSQFKSLDQAIGWRYVCASRGNCVVLFYSY
jgi:protein phosphatase methylesterase 1